MTRPDVSTPAVTAVPQAPRDVAPAPGTVPDGPPGLRPVRAALLLPLSGPSAALGAAMFNAAQLALFDLAEANFTLLPFDTQGTPDGAAEAARQAVAQNAHVVLGPIVSAEVKAAAPVVREARISMLSFSTDRGAAGDGVFVMGFLPRQQVDRVLGYARGQGLTRFAAIAPDTEYGRTVADQFTQAAARLGGAVTRVEFYRGGAEPADAVKRVARYDARTRALRQHKAQLSARGDAESLNELRRLDRADTLGEVDFDAVLLPDDGARLRNVAALLPFYDVDIRRVRVLGTMLWDDPGLGAEPALVGGWYPAPSPDGRADFLAAYARAFGAKPPNIASLAYDATALVAVLARQQADYGVAALTNANGFAGVDGIFRLLPDGTSERGLAVMEVTRGGPRVIDPAPETFQAQVY